MSDAILTVGEVFDHLTQVITDGGTLPEGYILDVRRPPGYGPPDDLILTVRAMHPVSMVVTFSTTVIRPPHTTESVDGTIAQLIRNVRLRLNAGSN